jgi:hypothetical protein
MKEELKKSLTDLIDETLMELEELKKSRFSAEEIQIKGPGANELAGKSVNGKLAAKAEDEKDYDDDGDEDDKDEAEKAEGVNDAVKSEGVNDAVKSEVEKAEDKKKDKKDDDKDEDDEGSKEHEAKEKDMAKKLLDMHKGELEEKVKKSVAETETLMKSYVDEKIAPLEGKLATILDMVTKIADAPVPAKGVSYKVAPLLKSTDEGEPLSKSEVANKLFELKKSGSRVDSADIARAEMGHDLEKIVQKYNIK